MRSHFSDIGFKFTKENFENEIENVIDGNKESLSKIKVGKEEYLVLFLDNLIELWFHFEDGAINPYDIRIHYHTSNFVEIEEIEKMDDEGLFGFDVKNYYPLYVSLPYYEAIESYQKDEKYKCQVACFAEDIEIYKDENDFYEKNEYEFEMDAPALPVGDLEGFEVSPTAMINGKVIAIDKKENSFTHNSYYLVTLSSYGADYEILLDAEDIEELEIGNIILGTFWITGKIMPLFYGTQLYDYKRQKPKDNALNTIGDLYNILQRCWSKETAYPSCQKDWVNSDKTYGQCAVTAMVVHDVFGGTIHKIRRPFGTHYFNKINNQYLDLTREQFDLYFIDVDYEPNQIVDRNWCGTNKDTNERYQLLIQKIVEEISKKN